MRITLLLAFLLRLSFLGCKQQSDESLLTNVNLFIETDEDGHTFPGVIVLFGMVQLSPDNGDHGYNWCSGYHYSSSTIQGFLG